MDNKNKGKIYHTDELVWVKYLSYPWWPGIVINNFLKGKYLFFI